MPPQPNNCSRVSYQPLSPSVLTVVNQVTSNNNFTNCDAEAMEMTPTFRDARVDSNIGTCHVMKSGVRLSIKPSPYSKANSRMCCVGSPAGSFAETDRILVPYKHIVWAEAADSNVMTLSYVVKKSSSPSSLVLRTSLVRILSSALEAEYTVAESSNGGGSSGFASTTVTEIDSHSKVTHIVKASSRLTSDRSSLASSASSSSMSADITAERIMDLAYQGIKKCRSFLVLVNPYSGLKNATSVYQNSCIPLFEAAHLKITKIETTHQGHAQEYIQQADLSPYDGIICVSGDGIVHEIFNGLASRPDGLKAISSLPVVHVPGGTGNGFAKSINGSNCPVAGVLNAVKGSPMRLDLMSFSQGDKLIISFLSQSYGIIADADVGTDDIRWMGAHRITYGVVKSALKLTTYPCQVAIKYAISDKHDVYQHLNRSLLSQSQGVGNPLEGETGPFNPGVLKYGTVNDPLPSDWVVTDEPTLSMFYSGLPPSMAEDALIFPAALPNDGFIDLVMVDTKIGRVKYFEALLHMETGGHFFKDGVKSSKVLAFRLTPQMSKTYVSVDGEPATLDPFQVEVLAGLGLTLSMTGSFHENAVTKKLK